MKFIYITPFVNEDFFIPAKKGMEDAAGLLGVGSVFTGTKDADSAALISLVKDAIGSNEEITDTLDILANVSLEYCGARI